MSLERGSRSILESHFSRLVKPDAAGHELKVTRGLPATLALVWPQRQDIRVNWVTVSYLTARRASWPIKSTFLQAFFILAAILCKRKCLKSYLMWQCGGSEPGGSQLAPALSLFVLKNGPKTPKNPSFWEKEKNPIILPKKVYFIHVLERKMI